MQNLVVLCSEWSDSKINALRVERTTFDERLTLSGSIIKGLRLSGVQYGPEFELESENTSFEDSDQLKRP